MRADARAVVRSNAPMRRGAARSAGSGVGRHACGRPRACREIPQPIAKRANLAGIVYDSAYKAICIAASKRFWRKEEPCRIEPDEITPRQPGIDSLPEIGLFGLQIGLMRLLNGGCRGV